MEVFTMPRRRPEPDDVTDIDPEELLDQIIENGKVVFTHDWDSGGLGAGAGSETVYCWKGQYAVDSLDNGPCGPYDALEDALDENDLLVVTSATTGITCPALSAKKLTEMLSCEEDGYVIEINGQDWVYREGEGFRRKRGRG
jgi:hypothetical protein